MITVIDDVTSKFECNECKGASFEVYLGQDPETKLSALALVCATCGEDLGVIGVDEPSHLMLLDAQRSEIEEDLKELRKN